MRPRPLLFPLVLALLLPLGGCRDTLVDPLDDPAGPATNSEETSPYFKGPLEMELGQSGSFRVEAVEGAERYTWAFEEDYSTGRLTGTFSTDAAGLERQFDAVAVEAGTVVLFVSITDEEGRAIAGVTKTVYVSPD